MLLLALLLLACEAPSNPGPSTISPDAGPADDTDTGLPDETGVLDDSGDPPDTGPVDADGDGWPAAEDCDEGDPAVYPGAEEVCGNGRDDDCDPATDSPCRMSGDHPVRESDIALTGETAYHMIGYDALFIPDVDGDGRDELLMHVVAEYDGTDMSFVPCAVVFFGGRAASATEGEADMTACSGYYGWGGYSGLYDHGDFDGDGTAEVVVDLIIGGSADVGTYTDYGAGFFDLARSGRVDVDDDMVVISGEAEDNASLIPSAWRDADEVGTDWLVLGGSGGYPVDHFRAFQAPVTSGTWDDADLRVVADDTWRAANSYRHADLGDLDGDGVHSLGLVGTDVSRPEDSETGAVAVVNGLPPDGAALVDIVDHVVWGRGEDGEDGYDHHGSGLLIRPAGDMDGDGRGDLLLVDQNAIVDGLSKVGCAHLFYSPLSAELELADSAARICGDEYGDKFATWADASGDVDGDGKADLLGGENDYSSAGDSENWGRVRLFYGSVAGGAHLVGDADATFIGANELDNATHPRSGGDFDGDGVDDFVVGAYNVSTAAFGAGAAYLFTGRGL